MTERLQLRKLVFARFREWARGVGIVAVGAGVWFVVRRFAEVLDGMFGGVDGLGLAALALLLVPWVLGWTGSRLGKPLLRHWQAARGLARWEERIVDELAPDERRGFPVVLVPWPSQTVRSLGMITNTFPGQDARGAMASVYIPNTPDARRGLLRIVPISELESTRFKLADLIQFQFSYGASGPETLLEADGGVEPASQ